MITGRECTAYHCVGDDFGVMVDTGEYFEDLQTFIRTLTDKPGMILFREPDKILVVGLK